MVPALLAIVVFITDSTIFDKQNSPMAGIYSLLMTFWGVYFIYKWNRHQRGLNVAWDNYTSLDTSHTELRNEFRGSTGISPVTDKQDTFFTFKQRLPYYLVSLLICLPCLAGCIGVTICFLNLTGVIRPKDHGGAFDIPQLSSLADEGAIFDPEGYPCMAIGIVQALTTVLMNLAFRRVASWSSNFENHKS